MDRPAAMSDLAAWTGLVGVVVGVVLTTGIDALRTRRAAVVALRAELYRVAEQIIVTAPTVDSLIVIGSGFEDPAWRRMLIEQEATLRAAMTTIRTADSALLDEAAEELRRAAAATARVSQVDGEADRLERQAVLAAAYEDFVDVLAREQLPAERFGRCWLRARRRDPR
jgi:hypothetical protein